MDIALYHAPNTCALAPEKSVQAEFAKAAQEQGRTVKTT